MLFRNLFSQPGLSFFCWGGGGAEFSLIFLHLVVASAASQPPPNVSLSRKKRRLRGGQALLPLQPRVRRAGEAQPGEPRGHQAPPPSAAATATKAAQRQPVGIQPQPGSPDRPGQRRRRWGRRRRSSVDQSQPGRKPKVLEHMRAAKAPMRGTAEVRTLLPDDDQ